MFRKTTIIFLILLVFDIGVLCSAEQKIVAFDDHKLKIVYVKGFSSGCATTKIFWNFQEAEWLQKTFSSEQSYDVVKKIKIPAVLRLRAIFDADMQSFFEICFLGKKERFIVNVRFPRKSAEITGKKSLSNHDLRDVLITVYGSVDRVPGYLVEFFKTIASKRGSPSIFAPIVKLVRWVGLFNGLIFFVKLLSENFKQKNRSQDPLGCGDDCAQKKGASLSSNNVDVLSEEVNLKESFVCKKGLLKVQVSVVDVAIDEAVVLHGKKERRSVVVRPEVEEADEELPEVSYVPVDNETVFSERFRSLVPFDLDIITRNRISEKLFEPLSIRQRRAVAAFSLNGFKQVGGQPCYEDCLDIYKSDDWLGFAIYSGYRGDVVSLALAGFVRDSTNQIVRCEDRRLLPALIKSVIDRPLIKSTVRCLYKKFDALFCHEKCGAQAVVCVMNFKTNKGFLVGLGGWEAGVFGANVRSFLKPQRAKCCYACRHDEACDVKLKGSLESRGCKASCMHSVKCEAWRVIANGGSVENRWVVNKRNDLRVPNSHAFGDYDFKKIPLESWGNHVSKYGNIVSVYPTVCEFLLSEVKSVYFVSSPYSDLFRSISRTTTNNPAELLCKEFLFEQYRCDGACLCDCGRNYSAIVIDIPRLLQATAFD